MKHQFPERDKEAYEIGTNQTNPRCETNIHITVLGIDVSVYYFQLLTAWFFEFSRLLFVLPQPATKAFLFLDFSSLAMTAGSMELTSIFSAAVL